GVAVRRIRGVQLVAGAHELDRARQEVIEQGQRVVAGYGEHLADADLLEAVHEIVADLHAGGASRPGPAGTIPPSRATGALPSSAQRCTRSRNDRSPISRHSSPSS